MHCQRFGIIFLILPAKRPGDVFKFAVKFGRGLASTSLKLAKSYLRENTSLNHDYTLALRQEINRHQFIPAVLKKIPNALILASLEGEIAEIKDSSLPETAKKYLYAVAAAHGHLDQLAKRLWGLAMKYLLKSEMEKLRTLLPFTDINLLQTRPVLNFLLKNVMGVAKAISKIDENLTILFQWGKAKLQQWNTVNPYEILPLVKKQNSCI